MSGLGEGKGGRGSSGEGGYYVVAPCASANAYEIVLKERKLDLEKAEKAFAELGTVGGNTGVVLIADVGGCSISAYASGRLMLKGKRLKSKQVNELAGRIMSALEKAGAVL